jgi:MFS family permease
MTSAARRAPDPRTFTIVAGAAFVLEASLFSTLAPLLPHFEEEFGMSSLGSGLLAGCYTAGMVVGSLFAGLWASGRFGVRSTALVGGGLLALASVGFGAAGSVPALDLARFVQGVGAGLLWVSLLNWLILVVPAESRGATLGSALGAAIFGTAVGPLLGGLTQAVGTLAIFIAVAVVVLGYVVFLARMPAPEPAAGDARDLARPRLPADPTVRRLAALAVVPSLLAGAVITLVPLQLSDLGAGETAISAILLAAALLCALCCAIAGRVTDRDGPTRPVLLGIVVTVVALVAMAAAGSPPPLAVCFVVFEGVGLSFAWIPLMSSFAVRGEAFGMSAAGAALALNLTMTAGTTIGAPLMTGIEGAAGDAAAYLTMAAIALAALAAFIPMRAAVEAPAEA